MSLRSSLYYLVSRWWCEFCICVVICVKIYLISIISIISINSINSVVCIWVWLNYIHFIYIATIIIIIIVYDIIIIYGIITIINTLFINKIFSLCRLVSTFVLQRGVLFTCCSFCVLPPCTRRRRRRRKVEPTCPAHRILSPSPILEEGAGHNV